MAVVAGVSIFDIEFSRCELALLTPLLRTPTQPQHPRSICARIYPTPPPLTRRLTLARSLSRYRRQSQLWVSTRRRYARVGGLGGVYPSAKVVCELAHASTYHQFLCQVHWAASRRCDRGRREAPTRCGPITPPSMPSWRFLAPGRTPPPARTRPTHMPTINTRFKRTYPPHTHFATESHPELTPTPYRCTGAVIGPTGSISARSDLPSLQEGPLELRGRCGAASAASVAPQGAPGRERVARRRWVLGPF